MQSNVKNPIFLNSDSCIAYSYPAGANTVEPYKITYRTGALVGAGTLVSLEIPDGITGNDAEANDDRYFTLVKREIAIVQVEPGEAIAYNDPISAADTGTGNARTGVPETDYIIGKALDISDGGGTVNDPHYIRVDLK